MPCTDPRTVGFLADGKTISWSSKNYSKEFATFQLPCGQCLECRLAYARQWAVRCVHEAQVYGDNNCFITLTYSDEKLKSPKLVYDDFQRFMKRLRKRQNDPIGVFVTGEYGNDKDQYGNLRPRHIHPIHGDVTKRPHWHAILFNYKPSDGKYKYTSTSGHDVYTSETLDKLWGNGNGEFGTVTLDSASYCARYAAKKLSHGRDGEHEFEPISKKSSKHAIGKAWLERHWPDVFLQGHVILDGKKLPIPRYYEKWLKDHRPDDWLSYVTRVKVDKLAEATRRQEAKTKEWLEANHRRRDLGRSDQLTDNQVRKLIQEKKFKELQAYLKL